MSIELLSFFVARCCTRSCCFIEETEFVIGLEEVSHGLTVVGSKGIMSIGYEHVSVLKKTWLFGTFTMKLLGRNFISFRVKPN